MSDTYFEDIFTWQNSENFGKINIKFAKAIKALFPCQISSNYMKLHDIFN